MIEERAAATLAAAPEDFARYGLRMPEDVAAGLVLDEESARAFASGGTINTDHHNVLATRAPRLSKDQSLVGAGFARVLSRFDSLAENAVGLDPGYLVRRLLITFGPGRARRFAAEVSDSATRTALLGWIDLAMGRSKSARNRSGTWCSWGHRRSGRRR